jgi:hypothetical protein
VGDILSDTLNSHTRFTQYYQAFLSIAILLYTQGVTGSSPVPPKIFNPCIYWGFALFTRILQIPCYSAKRVLHLFISGEVSMSLNNNVINMVYRYGVLFVSMGERVVVFFVDRLARWVIAIRTGAERQPLQS